MVNQLILATVNQGTILLPASNNTDNSVTEDSGDTVSDSEQDTSFVDTPTDNSPKDPSDDGYVDTPTEE